MNNNDKKSFKNKLIATATTAILATNSIFYSTSGSQEIRQVGKSKCNTELSILDSDATCEIPKNFHVKIIGADGDKLTIGAIINGDYTEGTAKSEDFYIVDIPEYTWENLDMDYVAYNPSQQHHIDVVNIRSTPEFDANFKNVCGFLELGDNVFGNKDNFKHPEKCLAEYQDKKHKQQKNDGVIIEIHLEPYYSKSVNKYVYCWYINSEGKFTEGYIHSDFIIPYEFEENNINKEDNVTTNTQKSSQNAGIEH